MVYRILLEMVSSQQDHIVRLTVDNIMSGEPLSASTRATLAISGINLSAVSEDEEGEVLGIIKECVQISGNTFSVSEPILKSKYRI